MRNLVNGIAKMPMPLLLGLLALVVAQLVSIVMILIWPDRLALISLVGLGFTVLVLLFWGGVIVWEQRTGRRWR